MDVDWNIVSSFFLSLVLHIVLAVLLVFSFDTTVRTVTQAPQEVNIVKAVSVDSKEVEKELKRLKNIEEQKKAAEQKKTEGTRG